MIHTSLQTPVLNARLRHGMSAWMPNRSLKLNVSKTQTLTSLWIPSSLFSAPPASPGSADASSLLQARSLRVTCHLLSLAPTSNLSASPVGSTFTVCPLPSTSLAPSLAWAAIVSLQDKCSHQFTGLQLLSLHPLPRAVHLHSQPEHPVGTVSLLSQHQATAPWH